MSLPLSAPVRRNKPKRNVNLIATYSNGTSSLAIQKNGRAWAWGVNSYGFLGDNTIVTKLTPVSVLGAVKTFCQIAGANLHSLAIDKNGRAWAWGANFYGNLGDNTIVSKLTPVSVLGAVKTFCQIAGGNHSLAIDKNGRAWAWGINSAGQLGNNSTISQRTPVSVLGAVKTFCKIAASYNSYSLAIDKNGRAWGWGNGGGGQLGDNTIVSKLTPVSVLGTVKTFCKIAAGGGQSLAIDKNGRAWAWGLNNTGQLGNNSTISQRTPVSVLGAVKTFCQIAAGSNHSLAIDKNGRAWAWGYNFYGQLGNNSTISQLTPVSVLGAVKTFCQIAAGGSHSLAIDKNGRAWGWGSNITGELGDDKQSVERRTPSSIVGNRKTFCQIAGGGSYSLAIDKNGRAWAWGYNFYGQLGNNSTIIQLTPVSVLGAVKTFCQIAGGGSHSLAIDKNGRAWAWGANFYGNLGDNTIVSKFTPVSVLGAVKTFCKIAGGGNHSLAIDKNGRAWAWGANFYGNLGDNTIVSKRTPVSVLGAVKTFCKIAGGDNHSLAIDKNGRAWAWGMNDSDESGAGQLGDNTIVSKLTPVSVVGAVKTFCQIAAGLNHSLAIDKNGRAWAWGGNSRGELGNNDSNNQLTPVSVLGAVKTFCQIAGGGSYSLAIDKNGRAWAWGANFYGQLGNTTEVDQLTPVSVLGTVKTFCKIAAGRDQSLAIDKNGGAWAWGSNSNGALGQDIINYTPIRVCNI